MFTVSPVSCTWLFFLISMQISENPPKGYYFLVALRPQRLPVVCSFHCHHTILSFVFLEQSISIATDWFHPFKCRVECPFAASDASQVTVCVLSRVRTHCSLTHSLYHLVTTSVVYRAAVSVKLRSKIWSSFQWSVWCGHEREHTWQMVYCLMIAFDIYCHSLCFVCY